MADEFDVYVMKRKLDKAEKELAETKEENKVLMQECDRLIKEKGELLKKTADIQPVDKDAAHIVYIGRKAYLAENTIKKFMEKMDIIRDSLARIESYFNTYAETIRQIRACAGECTDISEVKYFIDRIKKNCGYD